MNTESPNFTVEHKTGQEIAPRKEVMDIAISRAAQEVQAAMVIAKKFPRDETAAYERIMKACKRPALAECAVYEYPRGAEKVSGPSIRLAEALAQNWGNLDFGVIELEQTPNMSKVMAYAWDLETNTRQTKIFDVKHERHTKQGVRKLTDPRDIYEMSANQGARRLRACILGIIPGDITEAAVAECDRTLAGKNKEPLSDRIRKMVSAFSDFNVTPEMIEKRVGHTLDSLSESELVKLGKAYNSLRDGMAQREELFDVGAPVKEDAKKSQSDKVADLVSKPKPKEDDGAKGYAAKPDEKTALNSADQLGVLIHESGLTFADFAPTLNRSGLCSRGAKSVDDLTDERAAKAVSDFAEILAVVKSEKAP